MTLPVLRRNREESAPVSWRAPLGQPWSDFGELYERMGRLLSETFAGWDRVADGWRPAADVEETDDAYLVEVELPGLKQKDISVEFGSGELAITGEVKERQRAGLLRSRTRRIGHFEYRLSLPADVAEDQINASMGDGVLTVRVPKTTQAQRRKIPIST
jgi:HSP20 family protein